MGASLEIRRDAGDDVPVAHEARQVDIRCHCERRLLFAGGHAAACSQHGSGGDEAEDHGDRAQVSFHAGLSM